MRNEKLMFIDGWNILIAQNAVANIVDYNSNPIGMYLTTLNQIRNFVNLFKPNRIFFVLDGPNAGERRRKLHPDYKNKRKITGRKSSVIFKDEENPDDNFSYEVDGAFEYQFKKIYDFLQKLPVTVCIIPYCEADEVIAYMANKNKNEFDSIIVSTDKDYLQLIDENIFVYNWRKKTLYSTENFKEEFEISPNNYTYKRIILGDVSDNIKGTKQEGKKTIGEKTFKEIFSDLKENEIKEIGGFFDYLDNYDLSILPKKHHKHITFLKESKKEMLKNFQLMKLDEDYLKLHHINLLKQQVKEQQGKFISKFSLKLLMKKESFNKLSNGNFNPDYWLQPFVFLKEVEITL